MRRDSDKQVSTYVRTNYKPSMLAYGGNWQVIFELNGKDYCRETKPADMDIKHVISWADQQIELHGLSSAIIEFF